LLFALIVVPELKLKFTKFVHCTFAVIAEVPATVMLAASSMVKSPFAPPVIVTSVHVEEVPAGMSATIFAPVTFALIVVPDCIVKAPVVEVSVRVVSPVAAVHVKVPPMVSVPALMPGVVAVERHVCVELVPNVRASPENV